MAAFANMMALSKTGSEEGGDPTTVSRPWDTGRDGFVLGEGGAVLILESEEHARARGARIYAEVRGAGISNDAHDIAQPDPEGRGGTRAIKMALREGDVDPATVVHVNAHATSTPKGDIAEGLMLHAVLGEHVDRCVVTSTKSMTGHLLGGAGALEAVATVMALHDRVSPPTINLDNKDPEVDLDIPTSKPRPARRRHRRAQQLLRLRRRQRRGRLRQRLRTGRGLPMTTTATKPAKLPREQDPRNPVHRLTALLDEGTLELITADDDSGMLAAVGRVDGTSVVAFCSDATVMGGAMGDVGCRVVVDAYHRAITDGVPIIGLWHSGGARLAEGVLSLHAVGRIFQVMTQASGVIPQISVVLGPAAGGAAYGPALTDVVILGPEGRIFVTGPDVVRSVTGEDVDMLRLGGPEPHGRRSGVVHILTESEREALDRARTVASLLGAQGSLDGRRPSRTATSAPSCRSPRSAPTTCTRSSRPCSTRAPCRSCTPAGPPTSSPPSAASAAAPSASSPTTRCASAAASTRSRPRRRPASCACATPSACR